jgi:menaquinol-cytochrome c reductase iron-sulfur subunit
MGAMSDSQGLHRRKFYSLVISGLGAMMTAALAIPAGIYLLVPPRSKKSSGWVEAGDLSQLPLQTPEEVVFRRNRADGWKVTSEKSTAWVVKTSDREVVAFAPQCTHLGCAYHWDESAKNFLCPCHTSTFDLQGNVLSGPAPRPLDRYAVKLDGNKVLIGDIKRSDA